MSFSVWHGMGEPLYDEVVGTYKLNRPCRIYAPVGTHETLLAYLVRRLLENGANTSFVNRVANPDVQVEELVADPVEQAGMIAPLGAPHPKISSPRALFGDQRTNSAGIDLANEQRLASLSAGMLTNAEGLVTAAPMLAFSISPGLARSVFNPADRRDCVGLVEDATTAQATAAIGHACSAALVWGGTPAPDRAECLNRAASLLEERMPMLIGLIVREAGKSISAAISEVREAVDFLRYYGAQCRGLDGRPLGPVVCIKPVEFSSRYFHRPGRCCTCGRATVYSPNPPNRPR